MNINSIKTLNKIINMKLKLFFLLMIFSFSKSYSQVSATTSSNIWYAKEFSKDIALYHAKTFLINNVLEISSDVVKFEVIPLAAANSGELTTLLYKCETKKKEGLVLGFFGNYVNESGVLYQGYSYKNLNVAEASEFLNKIQEAIDNNENFLRNSIDTNNIYFKYNDIDVLIWGSAQSFTIRLYWNGFDSSWEKTAYDRSKRRFEKKIK